MDEMMRQDIDNLKLLYHKTNGVIMYSGTLALEAALRLAGLGNGDKVLINNLACYSVLQAVNNSGCIPVLMQPLQSQVVLESIDVIHAVKELNIKGFIAIHQYGVYQEIEQIKKACHNIIIIEDASQAWGIISPNNIFHQYSDYIVFSLGKTKPLGYGIGGVLLSNNDFMMREIDTKDRESRYKESRLILYMMPMDFEINMSNLIEKANNKIAIQQKKAHYYNDLFMNNKYIDIIKEKNGYQFSWHRYPVFVSPTNETYLLNFLFEREIQYQKEFSLRLNQLEMAQNSNFIEKKNDMVTYLLRTQ